LSSCEQQQNAFSALRWSGDTFQNIYNFLMRSNKAAFVKADVVVAVVFLIESNEVNYALICNVQNRALRSVVIVLLLSFNRLIAKIIVIIVSLSLKKGLTINC